MTQSYVVLARKWRPTQFKDIVGQAHIVRTLTNAIRSQRIHQAYLFTGSRGIGKTSIARIFAKVLRCEFTQETDGFLYSCDQCPSCKEITYGNSVDVAEIDGASNNGVEAIREIRENAKYMPANGSRKIYIIDEVHMLTTAAFNALLKTLEEPPAHVIFIFATTEPQKIPATVLSRCQRFDYRKVTLHQIQSRLEDVVRSEGIEAESGALSIIARAADGSMRDALSLLDQVIAFSGSQITTQSTRESIGLISGQLLIQILTSVFNRTPLQAVEQVELIHQQGHDLRILARGLIEFLYVCILIKLGSTQFGSLELSESEISELREITPARSLEEMEVIFQVLHHGMDWIARSPQPKLVLNVLLIKCATAEALISIENEQKSPQNVDTPQLAPHSIEPKSAPLNHSTTPTGPSNPAEKFVAKPREVTQSEQKSPLNSSPSQSLSPSLSPSPDSALPISSPSALPSAQPSVPPPTLMHTQMHSPTPSSPHSSHLSPKGVSEKSWGNFVAFIRQTRPLLASMLEHAIDSEIPSSETNTHQDFCLGISFSPEEGYFKEQLQAKAYQEQLLTLSREYFGRPVRLQIDFKSSGESFAAKREREEKQRIHSAKERALNHPILVEAKSLFGGNLGPIEIKEDQHHVENSR